MATISGSIIIGCWIIFMGYWAVSAFGQKAMAEQKSFLSSLIYRIPLMLGGLFLWFPRFPHPLNLALTPHPDLARAFGAVVCLSGLWVTISARRTLGGQLEQRGRFQAGARTREDRALPLRAASHLHRPAPDVPGNRRCGRPTPLLARLAALVRRLLDQAPAGGNAPATAFPR